MGLTTHVPVTPAPDCGAPNGSGGAMTGSQLAASMQQALDGAMPFDLADDLDALHAGSLLL